MGDEVVARRLNRYPNRLELTADGDPAWRFTIAAPSDLPLLHRIVWTDQPF